MDNLNNLVSYNINHLARSLSSANSFSELVVMVNQVSELDNTATSEDFLPTKEFFEFFKSEGFDIKCLFDFGSVNVKTNNESLKLFSGFYSFTLNDLHFLYVNVFNKNSSQEMFSGLFFDRKDCDRVNLLKSKLTKFNSKNKVFIPGIGKIEIKDLKPSSDLVGLTFASEVKEKINNFYKSTFFKENNLKYVDYMLFEGPIGSGKSTFIKSLIHDLDLTTVSIPNTLSNETLVETFKMASELSPSFLALDAMDEWLGTSVDYSLFIQLLNNFDPKKGCFILATVQEKQNLSEELSASHRFSDVYKFTLPDEKSSKEFLDKTNLFDSGKTKKLAKKAKDQGFEWEHLTNFVNACKKVKGTGELDGKVDSLFDAILKEKKAVDKKINFDKYFE